MTRMMRRITLASRPLREAATRNFRLEELPIPELNDGEVLVRVEFLSLDPYMRGRMSDAPSYAPPVALGATMIGATVGRVVDSRAEGFRPGDLVLGMLGWADHGIARAEALRKLPEGIAPSTALGVLGMPGYTGWWGLTQIGRPQPGETVVVAAATGPVGSMVGQIARARGARAVGIAGGPAKCAEALEVYGFDRVIDHHAHDAEGLGQALRNACPDGIDVYFENVGGKVLEAVLPQMNPLGRIPLCGTIAWYEGEDTGRPASLPWLWRQILVRRLTIQGFIILENWGLYDNFLTEVAPLVADGRIQWREDVAEGLAAAPEAFLRMLHGGNRGKQVVRM